jgi:hypothetical protein
MYQESTPEEPVAESPDDIQKMLNMKMVVKKTQSI